MNRRITLVALCAILAACGSATAEDGAAGAQTGDDVVPAAAATTTPPSTTGSPTGVPAECEVDRRTLEVAIEAYFAQNGAYPASETDLTDARMIRAEFDTYDVGADGSIVRVAAVACDATDAPEVDEQSGGAASVEDYYASFTDSDIDAMGGPECAREIAVIAAAGARYVARQDMEPTSMDDLAGDLQVPITLWRFDAGADSITPADGSPCNDVFSQNRDEMCRVEYRTLQTAIEAYLADTGTAPESLDVLVGGYLRELPDGFGLAGGEVVSTPGSECEAAVADFVASESEPVVITDGSQCDVARHTLEMAIDAFTALNGAPPADDGDLVGDFIRVEYADFDVVDGDVVAVAGSVCP